MSSDDLSSVDTPGAPEHLGWLVKRVQHSHHRALDLRMAVLGLTLVQWNALREIERNPGFSQRKLAEHTFNSDQAFGTLVGRLLAADLVERYPGVGRAALHRLTSKGATLLRKGQRVMSEVIAASFAPLTPSEREELGRLLAKVLNTQGA